MFLKTMKREPIPPHEWLQFDTKNQEFYGVPMVSDIGRKEYQLETYDKNSYGLDSTISKHTLLYAIDALIRS